MEPPPSRRNSILFGVLCVASFLGVIAYILYSRSPLPATGDLTATDVQEGRQALETVRQQPHLMFRSTALGQGHGRLTLVSLSDPQGTRYRTELTCERVYGTAAGGGIVLQAHRRAFATFKAVGFDAAFQPLHSFELAGAPSRTRLSRDGSLASITVFVAGHGYADINLSTQTTLYKLPSTVLVQDLEELTVMKDGEVFKKQDFNFWGVTFIGDEGHFYSTLASGGTHYLVRGDLGSRQVTVIREGVECPSLSPDETRIAFKHRTRQSARLVWQLHVLNLETGTLSILSETRSVDDQAEWLDNDYVLYGMPRNEAGSGASDVWMARADGTGEPSLFVPDAWSPCVVRP